MSLLIAGVGLDDLARSLPTQTLLWFYDSAALQPGSRCTVALITAGPFQRMMISTGWLPLKGPWKTARQGQAVVHGSKSMQGTHTATGKCSGVGDTQNVGKQCWRTRGLCFWLLTLCGLSCRLFSSFLFFACNTTPSLFWVSLGVGMQWGPARRQWGTEEYLHIQATCLHTPLW